MGIVKGAKLTLRFFGRVRVVRVDHGFVLLQNREGKFVLNVDYAYGLMQL